MNFGRSNRLNLNQAKIAINKEEQHNNPVGNMLGAYKKGLKVKD